MTRQQGRVLLAGYMKALMVQGCFFAGAAALSATPQVTLPVMVGLGVCWWLSTAMGEPTGSVGRAIFKPIEAQLPALPLFVLSTLSTLIAFYAGIMAGIGQGPPPSIVGSILLLTAAAKLYAFVKPPQLG